jgi:hypothetical protein
MHRQLLPWTAKRIAGSRGRSLGPIFTDHNRLSEPWAQPRTAMAQASQWHPRPERNHRGPDRTGSSSASAEYAAKPPQKRERQRDEPLANRPVSFAVEARLPWF